jgi:hypothetical protein
MKLTTESCAIQVWLMGGALLAIAQASADPAAARPIYRCDLGGQSVFSDRPCGSDASTYEADTGRVSITQSAPVKISPTQDSGPQERRRGAAGGNAQARARHAATCERIESGLREIRARMRSGYNARQGERLKERQQALQVKRRAARCR